MSQDQEIENINGARAWPCRQVAQNRILAWDDYKECLELDPLTGLSQIEKEPGCTLARRPQDRSRSRPFGAHTRSILSLEADW